MDVTVPVLTIIMMVLSAAVAILVPIVALVKLRRRTFIAFAPAGMGMLIYFVFAVMLEFQFATILVNLGAQHSIASSPVVLSLFTALAAGFFEETGRLCAFYLLLRKGGNNTPAHALAYGLGHGMLQSVLIGFSLLYSAFNCFTINQQGADALLRLTAPENMEAMENAITALAQTPAHYYLSQIVERVSILVFHLAASVLVWLGASGRLKLWTYPLAIGLHVVMTLPVAFLQTGVLSSIWLAVLWVVAAAGGTGFLVLRLYQSTLPAEGASAS